MACLSENLVVAFFSRGRSPEIVAQVDAHAAGCEKCRRLLAEYAALATDGTAALPVDAGVVVPPTLTPLGDAPDPRADFVRRIVQSQAQQRVGTMLNGKWKIERLIGTGGMAHVYEARHRNGRRVAIKFMRLELALEPSLVERFLREGYVANKVDHPGAVAILDDDVAPDGSPFLVMELLVGETLRERMQRGRVPLREALVAIAAVLDVLAVAHDKQIVHRDLKPDNLFRTEDGAIKILDFGIARLKERARPEVETRSGTTLGTVGFMPPEQARGLTNEVDARSDVWAVGATLYALLTGRHLHEASTTNEALLLAMTTPVPPMATLLPWLPVPVQALLDQALAFRPADRFVDARAMRTALEAARERVGATVALLPGAPPSRAPAASQPPAPPSATLLGRALSRRGLHASDAEEASAASSKLAWALAIGAGLLVGSIAAFVALRPDPPPRGTPATDVGSASEPRSRPADERAGAATLVATPPAEPVEAPSAPPLPAAASSATADASRAAPSRPAPTPPPPSRPAPTPPPSASPVPVTPSPPAPGRDTRDPLGPRR